MQKTSPPETPLPDDNAAQASVIHSRLILVLALCFVGMNLRPVLISLGPVLDSVRLALDLSGASIGILITLPVLCFGLFAPFVPRLLRYRSAHQLIFINLLILAAGIGLRSLFGATGLFAGTLVAGASISVIMVLLPSLIKDSFPAQAGLMMGVYSGALCLGATIAAAATVPLENIPGSNWQWALAFWLIPALACAVVWRGQLPPVSTRRSHTSIAVPSLRKNKLAWHITMFMGLQSAIAYCVFGWLPLILIDRGLTALTAGFVLSVTMAVQLLTSISAAWVATRGKDQRAVLAVLLICVLIGLAGLFYGSLDLLWVYTTVMGLGLGGVFSIALALLVLRSPNAHVAAALSGMVQGVGYIVAATGPFIVGLLHEYFGHWHGVAVFFALLIIGSFCFGMSAGRARFVMPDPDS